MNRANPALGAAPASRVQQVLTIACLTLIALVVVGQALLPEVRDRDAGSTSSARPDGRRALLLALEELGFAPEVWARPPGALPRGRHVLWMATAPTWTDAAPEESAPGASDSPPDPKPARETRKKRGRAKDPDLSRRTRYGLHAPEHYLRFVESGGTLVLPWTLHTRQFLADALAIEGVGKFDVREDDSALVTRRVRLANGTELDARWPAKAELPSELCDTLAQPLWFAAYSLAGVHPDVLAATIALGDGRVVLLGSDAFARNDELGALQDGELAVRLVEEQGAVERVLFDEYALGDWKPESALELAFSPGIAPVTWHVLLLLALLVWLHAWVRAFPRDPEPLGQLSPLSRAQAQANVLERARRHSVLAGFARRAALARLQKAAGLGRAAHELATPAAIELELGRIADRLGLTDELAAWRRVWLERRVASARELDALQAELDAIVALAAGRVPARALRR